MSPTSRILVLRALSGLFFPPSGSQSPDAGAVTNPGARAQVKYNRRKPSSPVTMARTLSAKEQKAMRRALPSVAVSQAKCTAEGQGADLSFEAASISERNAIRRLLAV